LNGSVNLLAQAMKQFFQESIEGAVDPLSKEIRNDIEGVERRLYANMADLKDDLCIRFLLRLYQ